jgi:hypothetical protein
MATELDTLEFVEGDTLPVISGVLTEDDGTTPINITGYTIELHIKYDTPLTIAATIPAGTDGYFYFPWASDSLKPKSATETGLWFAEIQIQSPLGIQTAQRNENGKRFKIKVYPQID